MTSDDQWSARLALVQVRDVGVFYWDTARVGPRVGHCWAKQRSFDSRQKQHNHCGEWREPPSPGFSLSRICWAMQAIELRGTALLSPPKSEAGKVAVRFPPVASGWFPGNKTLLALAQWQPPWMLLLLMESKFPTHLAEKVTRGTASPASALSPSPQMVRQGSVGFGLGSHLFPRIFGYFLDLFNFPGFFGDPMGSCNLWSELLWTLKGNFFFRSMVWQLRSMDLGKNRPMNDGECKLGFLMFSCWFACWLAGFGGKSNLFNPLQSFSFVGLIGCKML